MVIVFLTGFIAEYLCDRYWVDRPILALFIGVTAVIVIIGAVVSVLVLTQAPA